MSDLRLPASGLTEDILPKYRDVDGELHLVTFNLGEEYGVSIEQVREVVRIPGITPVPNSPSYMEGVINLRGRVLPVLNLRKRLRLPDRGFNRASRIIVTETGDKVIGLLADSVSHVIKVPSRFVESAPEEVLEVDTDYITGVGKLEDRLIILLDLEKLFRREKFDTKESQAIGGTDNENGGESGTEKDKLLGLQEMRQGQDGRLPRVSEGGKDLLSRGGDDV